MAEGIAQFSRRELIRAAAVAGIGDVLLTTATSRAAQGSPIKAMLSNATPTILGAGIANGGLEDAFEHVLSTDTLRTYKPDPIAYGLAPHAFRLGREEILFVAFAGWDVVGAKAFGYPTFWVNRSGLPAERLGFVADETGRDLAALVTFLSGEPGNARSADVSGGAAVGARNVGMEPSHD